jgi:hypothetical protein
MDQTPSENEEISKNRNEDPNYKKKLEISYNKCLDELCFPCENWEDKILEAKFTVDPVTGQPKNTCIFELAYPDNIITDDTSHTYVFKRSHFYNSFLKQRSRLKRDLINCWKGRGYFVRLYNEDNKWFLSLRWRNNEDTKTFHGIV